MSGLMKYRVHEVAKDFGMTSKEITQILTDYATTPKNHMQVLEDDELNDIFEYLTQHHQAASLEELYKVPDQPKAKLYKDGRHEMLNELNKDEVYADILDWLNSKI